MILRWLFGYYNERNLAGWTEPPQWPRMPSTGKSRTCFKAVTLVGIDIDNLREEDGIPLQFHIGISILQIQDLHNLCYCSSSVADAVANFPRGNVIQSHHWAVEDPNYFSKNDNRFCFGKHRSVQLSDLRQSLEELLRPFHPYIVVCHGISRERIVLRKLNLDLKPLFEIDTTKAARYPLREFHDSTLKKLTRDFNIPISREIFHVAGNDAHLVLRALLMIAVTDATRELGKVPPWVRVFEAVARAPLPPMPLKGAQKAKLRREAKKESSQKAEAGDTSGARCANVIRTRTTES